MPWTDAPESRLASLVSSSSGRFAAAAAVALLSSAVWALVGVHAGLILGSALLGATFAWTQIRAVRREDGRLVPTWWVVTIVGLLVGGPIALYCGGVPATVAAGAWLVVGIASVPVAAWVDRRRAEMARLSALGTFGNPALKLFENPDSLERLMEGERSVDDAIMRLCRESPAARRVTERVQARA